jgi:glycerate 2-kinase
LDLPDQLIAIYQAALVSCDAGRLLEQRLQRDPPRGPVFMVGLGKPAAAMLRGAQSFLGPQLEGGLMVVPEGSELPSGPSVELRVGGHPYPDARSASAGEALLATAATIPKDLSPLVLLAGGGSALAVAPAGRLALRSKVAAHKTLLHAGLPIQIVNGVRSHLSRIKGGGLLRALALSPAVRGSAASRPKEPSIRVEVLSDVGEGEIHSVASGPCSPDQWTFEDCLEAVQPVTDFPAAARKYLREGARALRPETLKPGDPLLSAVAYHCLASPKDLLKAAVDAARAQGLRVEARERPWQLSVANAVETMEAWLVGSPVSQLLVAVGEVHLSLPEKPGVGGRAQHLALTMAPILAKHRAALLVAGSDGRDGNSPFSGTVVGSDLAARAEHSRLDIAAALARCDASAVISALGLGLPARTPTTNLTDLFLLAREA